MISIQDNIIPILINVVDPELGINIVDLGLIYNIKINDGNVDLYLTLTSVVCPLSDIIEEQIYTTLFDYSVEVHWVWEPLWDMEMISESGLEELKAIGFSI